MEPITQTIIICITVLVALILILNTVEKVIDKVNTPPPQQDVPDIGPLEIELADIKTKLGSIQIANGFKKR